MALVLVITLLANTSGIAQADDGQKSKDGQIGIWTRVAQAFNTTAENVRNVFMQARSENREEMTSGKLDALVTAGKITLEQATELKAWIAQKPAGPFVDKNTMEKLLKEGKITQEQVDARVAWREARPDIQLPKPIKPGGNIQLPKPGKPGGNRR